MKEKVLGECLMKIDRYTSDQISIVKKWVSVKQTRLENKLRV
jgi:hypothetical protein